MTSQAQAIIDLFASKPWATLAEVDRAIWPTGPLGSLEHRRTVVCRARKVLAAQGKHINSIHGIGYRLDGERMDDLPGCTPLAPVRLTATPRPA
jgi:DNA-binding response OmpR family regulator